MIGGTTQKLCTPQTLTEAACLQNRQVIETQPVSGMFNYKQGEFHSQHKHRVDGQNGCNQLNFIV